MSGTGHVQVMALLSRIQPSHYPHTAILLMTLLTFDLVALSAQESAFILEKDNFQWRVGGWMRCVARDKDNCTQSRVVECRNGVNQRAPPNFCKPEERPEDSKPCAPCPEDCLLSAWSGWSECSATCAPAATKIRTREVMRSEINGGGACGALSELEICVDLPECGELMTSLYTWRTGEWTSCRKLETIDIACGLGQRTRSVACIDESGRNVPENGCLPRSQGHSPSDLEICSVPCDCELSEWTEWSPCSQTCLDTLEPGNVGSEMRSREIQRLPDKDGLPCAHLGEQRECDHSNRTLPECPVFEWITQDWQDCKATDGVCGGGEEWRQVYCSKTGDITLQPVDEKHCVETAGGKEPASRRACWKECPVDCQLGEWENWSACSESCGEGGHHIRQREVLTEPAHGGTPCDAQYQVKECEPVECAWWRTGAWSTCFLINNEVTCGPGSWYRVMYCISSLDTEVDESNCDAALRPLSQDDCTVPCPEDCIVSEWSKWGPCSVSCGKQGGVQTRWREILAHGADPEPCLNDSELIQTQVCNLHVSCDTYIWQVSPWEECSIIEEGVATCGDSVGVQKRNITCEIDSGVAANETLCLSSQRPGTHQPCDIPCPVDCVLSEWSAWSECNQTCGPDTHRERSKVILTLAANGGLPCPNDTDEEGVLYESEPCEGAPPCYSYRWHQGNWSDCLVARDHCGQGLRDREVTCRRNDGVSVDPGFCVREVSGPVPLSHEQCHVPCGGDCELTEWTVYGPCGPNCGSTRYTGYCRQRSKKLVVDHPEESLTLCPDLTPNDLLEIIPCTNQDYNYTTVIGPWSQCIVDGGCGRGSRQRSVACIREDGQMVPHDFCPSEPPVSEECVVECPQDCTVSDWLNWSPCSARCGTGLKMRQRMVGAVPQGGGKECPHLAESTPCHLATCDSFLWVVGDWSPCYLANQSVNCGPGTRNRSVACPAGEAFGADCAERSPRPPQVTPCELPCPGDCVVSEWSEFTPCSEECDPVGQKNRTRTVIRPPAVDGQPCGSLVEVVECGTDVCRAVQYRNETTDWTQCKPHYGDCGPGVQWQVAACVDDATGLPVTPDRCNQSEEVAERECSVACPIDCEYKEFSDWSACSLRCGREGIQSRSRVLLTDAKHGGRSCSGQLNQTRPCNIQPCFSYEWLREPWGDCHFDSFTGCGVGVEARRVECMRSDGMSVALQFCILPEEMALLRNSDIIQEFNMSALDIVSSRTCDRPCPGDCVLSEWSEYSPCLGSCFDPSILGRQTRSRHITAFPSPDGLQCPDDIIEARPCSDPVCADFSWNASPWDQKEISERDVWCEMKGPATTNVTGGCLEVQRPAAIVLCREPLCAEYGSVCDAGTCKCLDGFEGNGVACFPKEVCRDDSDCSEILHESYCAKGGVCRCEKSYDLRDGTCRVPYARTHTNKTWVWFVIAGCCVAAVLILLCAIYYVSRAEKEGGFQPLDYNSHPPPLGAEDDPEMIKMSMMDGEDTL